MAKKQAAAAASSAAPRGAAEKQPTGTVSAGVPASTTTVPSSPSGARSHLVTVACVAVLAIAVALAAWQSPSSRPASAVSGLISTEGGLPSPPHWGTYRPNLYLGVRGLWGASPLFGWLWSCAPSSAASATCGAEAQVNELRHDAEERDGLTQYGWNLHDGDAFGRQGLVDKKMEVNLTTSFIRPEGQGDRWAVRIEGQPLSKSPSSISLYFYTALADADHTLQLLSKVSSTGLDGALGLRLHAGAEGGEVVVRADLAAGSKAASPSAEVDGKQRELDQTYYYGVYIDPSTPSVELKRRQAAGQAAPQQYTWAAKDIVKNALVEQWRSAWGKHSSRFEGAKRAHESSQRGSPNPTQYQPPPMPFTATLPNSIQRGANVLVIQRVLTLPFTMDFVLQPAGADELNRAQKKSDTKEVGGTDAWFGSSLAKALTERARQFEAAFTTKFPLTAVTSATEAARRAQRSLAQSLLSNMLGGIGYFHGPQLVEQSPAKPATRHQPAVPARIVETAPSSLFTAVPSRSFFPRGFMWDEGFHQLLISTWSLDLSLDVLASWFGQIQLDSSPPGWLPREQILGEEARRRVPQEFQAQKPWVANPPVLILALEKILERLQKREAEEKASSEGLTKETERQMRLFDAFLAKWLPTIHTHIQWFFTTQASAASTKVGTIAFNGRSATNAAKMPLSFRWVGRTMDHCLASGLDDYPRAKYLPQLVRDKTRPSVPADQAVRDKKAGVEDLVRQVGEEGHVDLHAWMIVLAKTMGGLTNYLHSHVDMATGEQQADTNYAVLSKSYTSYASELSKTLLQLHWDAKSSSFSDYVYRNGTRSFVSHVGYVSLLPLFLTVLDPRSPELAAILSQFQSEAWSLWTPAGLRSLSAKDSQFGSGEDYWRGHIWINMQYLACQGLTHYAKHTDSPTEVRDLARRLSKELRHNVATNVAKEYQRTGYAWEQYHALTFNGRKSHPFTGWTALTLLIMTEEQ